MVVTTGSIDSQSLLEIVAHAVVQVLPQQHSDPFEHYAVRRIRLAHLIIHSIDSDPVTVRRRVEDIAADSVFDFLLHTQLVGSAEIEQGDIRFTLNVGALAIVPGGVPYRVSYPEKGRKLILRIPHQVFHERVLGREIRDFGATLLEGDGLVPILIDLLKSLTLEADRLTDIEQYTLADSFLALLGAAFRSRARSSPKHDAGSQSARMCRILSYVEEHFSDHELTPAKVAKANFVSVRHLHSLFHECGTTVAKWIWDRRLSAAREDMLDLSMADLTICEIAYRRGFNDSAHFSRAFKIRYGISPSLLRAKAAEANIHKPH